MLWTIIAIPALLWLLGLLGHIGGGLIHLLLVVAIVALIFNSGLMLRGKTLLS